MMGWFYESFVPGEIFVGWDCGEDIVWGARSHSVECIAQLSSIKPRQSAMDSKSVRSYIFSSAPRAGYRRDERLKPGVPATSTGLWPLIVSRVKCGGGPCRGHSVLPCVGNTICLQYPFYKKCGGFDIGLPETRSGRDRVLPI